MCVFPLNSLFLCRDQDKELLLIWWSICALQCQHSIVGFLVLNHCCCTIFHPPECIFMVQFNPVCGLYMGKKIVILLLSIASYGNVFAASHFYSRLKCLICAGIWPQGNVNWLKSLPKKSKGNMISVLLLEHQGEM